MDYPPINIHAFSLTFCVFWSFWNDKRKIEKQQKMKLAIEIPTCHVDGQGYVEKHFFGCVTRKLKQNKISTCYTKNIDRILTRLGKLRSNLRQSLFETTVESENYFLK